ncbi:MAG: hypothetical protein HWQ35_28985 [Nostoc sp. NMS1]|uniref:hypothetical protein n=1 Tax=unclassified Nostoc TaxID=2593658 RepID=UPI0025F8FC9B|nr:MULTISPECIES: hypothetical protein [unclassified Nostoc]MBN3910432.1 hypothetical protein [Nostoc sp. NMS1]MBN3992607.1 hypothetical protein [Nostoc sp. NMS2]
MKLQRIEAGEYLTPDGRFYVRNTYYSNGLPGRSNTTKGWLIEDRSGATPFQVSSSQKTKLRRVDTLAQAREIMARIIQRDAEAKKLRDAGWCKEENTKQPGVCWRSPYSGRLLTQTEALLELNLMS